MLELDMAALLGNLEPSIGFDFCDNIATIHVCIYTHLLDNVNLPAKAFYSLPLLRRTCIAPFVKYSRGCWTCAMGMQIPLIG